MFLLILGGRCSTQRALQHSGCQGDDQRVALTAHTHAHAYSPRRIRAPIMVVHTNTHTNQTEHFVLFFFFLHVYKLEWILIVLNRAFTKQMLFLGLTVHPHMISPMMHIYTVHRHTNAQNKRAMLMQTFLAFL